MSERVVLDASALLALIKNEPGANLVAAALPDAMISTVNYAEVLGKLSDNGWPHDMAANAIRSLGLEVVNFNVAQAEATGRLRTLSRQAGLSLGDRACLALGLVSGLEVLTADAAWVRIADQVGLAITDIRNR
jgi:PIN domain nuclease of toxin-antitoxin system